MFRFTIRDVIEPEFLRSVVGGAAIVSFWAAVICAAFLVVTQPEHEVGDVIESTGQQVGMFCFGIAILGAALGAVIGALIALARINRRVRP